MLDSTRGKVVLLLLHIFIGILFVYSPRIMNKGLVVLFSLIGGVYIYSNKNKNEEAFFVAFYFVAAEVFLRMTKSTISWDFGKYVTMALLVTGLLTETKKRSFPVQFVLYLLLISIGIAFTDLPASAASYRKAILFNISGPIALGVCSIYFYKRKISLEQLKKAFHIGVLPVVSMVVYLYFRTPSLKEIVFNSAANFEASGGFGPNQVSTSLGFAVFLIGALILLKHRISGFLALDYFILFYVIYRALLTFSRGGMFTGVGAFVVLLLFYLADKGSIKDVVKYVSSMTILSIAVWMVSSNVTGGMLNNRYLGKSTTGEEKEDITSGRTDIIEIQLQSFYEHPLTGLGVASGDYRRKEEYEGVMSTSHNEVGRLLEEHGLIGLLSLILLFVDFGMNFKSSEGFLYKGLILSFFILWFLTINHSGMRIAFPSFIYGLCLISLPKKDVVINE